MSVWRFWGTLGAWLLLCFATAFAGARATVSAGAFYQQLQQPVWAPPGFVFGPVWSLLYALMAVAAWRVSLRPDSRAAPGARFFCGAVAGQRPVELAVFCLATGRGGADRYCRAVAAARHLHRLVSALRPGGRLAACALLGLGELCRSAELLAVAAQPRRIVVTQSGSSPEVSLAGSSGSLSSTLISRIKMPQKAINKAATVGPMTKPLMPNSAMPPKVESSTR